MEEAVSFHGDSQDEGEDTIGGFVDEEAVIGGGGC